jgi:DNA-3-methyladenine glycosylase
MALQRNFYARETTKVARDLIGKLLVSEADGRTKGRIVETEAYLPNRDSACHAAKHRTSRTEVMFGPAGFAYVYPIHAKFCFNIVTELEEMGCAVLIRAIEPIDGVELMKRRRGLKDERRLATGPSCLCQAMRIDRSINQLDLTLGKTVWIEEGLGLGTEGITIKSSKRIGVTSATTRRLRYYVAGNRFVSGPVRLRT